MTERKPCRWYSHTDDFCQWWLTDHALWVQVHPPWAPLSDEDDFDQTRHCANCPCYEPKEDSDGR